MTRSTPPWGYWEVLLDESYCKVKRVAVMPGHRLSYQKHFKRYETWVIVAGTATVTLNGISSQHHVGEVVRIPIEAEHRVANQGTEPLILIEVQQGIYFGEDDIVRLEDDYARS